MIPYQNPIFQTEIEKPIAEIKESLMLTFKAYSKKYTNIQKN